MAQEELPYQVYLLRLWPVAAGDCVTWRASLQCVSSGERHGFADRAALFAYLTALTAQGPAGTPGGGLTAPEKPRSGE